MLLKNPREQNNAGPIERASSAVNLAILLLLLIQHLHAAMQPNLDTWSLVKNMERTHRVYENAKSFS